MATLISHDSASLQVLGKWNSSPKPVNTPAKKSRPLPRPEDIWKLLEKTKREILLAILQPSKDLSDQPICTLEVVSLDEDPQYEALSYTWGDAKVTRPIKLQGVQCPVAVNLEAELRQLQYPSMARIIWIDAIGINQSSN